MSKIVLIFATTLILGIGTFHDNSWAQATTSDAATTPPSPGPLGADYCNGFVNNGGSSGPTSFCPEGCKPPTESVLDNHGNASTQDKMGEHAKCIPRDDVNNACKKEISDYLSFKQNWNNDCDALTTVADAGASANLLCKNGGTSVCFSAANDAIAKARKLAGDKFAEIKPSGASYTANGIDSTTGCPKDALNGIKTPDYPPDETDPKDTSTSASATAGQACKNVPLQDRMNDMKDHLTGEDSNLIKRQTTFNDSETKNQAAAQHCTDITQSLRARIQNDTLAEKTANDIARATISADAGKARAIMSKINEAIDEANTEANDINSTQMNAAMTDYQNAIAIALKACYSSLQDLAKKNRLRFGDIGSAISASQVGITNFQCQKDFDYQQQKAMAYRAYIVKMQALQTKYAQIQAKIASLGRDLVNTKLDLSADDQRIIDEGTSKIAAARLDAQQASTALTANDQTCQAMLMRNQNLANSQMANVNQVAASAQTDYCALSILEKQTGLKAQPGEKSDQGKALQKAQDDLNDLKTVNDPCTGTCSSNKVVCNGATKDPPSTTRGTTQ